MRSTTTSRALIRSALPRSWSHNRVLIALVGLAVLLAVVLPLETMRLLRDRRAVSRQEARMRLEDAAHFVAERIDASLADLSRETLLPAMATNGSPVDQPPPLSSFSERVSGFLGKCECVRADGYAFRLVGGRLEGRGTSDPRVTIWLSDTLRHQVRLHHERVWSLRKRPLTPTAEIGPDITTFVTGMLVAPEPLDARLLLYIAFILPDSSLGPVYGLDIEREKFLGFLVNMATRQAAGAAWPGAARASNPVGWIDSGRGDAQPDGADERRLPFVVAVSDFRGRELFRTPGARAARADISLPLPLSDGRLVLSTYARSDVLSTDGDIASEARRLWLLAAMFMLTMGLLSVAVVQLRRQAELSRVRARFISGVSHELRSPLAQIRLFAELLREPTAKDRVHGGPSAASRRRSDDYARIIDEETQRLTHLVDNILTFTTLDRGGRRTRMQPIDLSREVRDAVDAFAPLARANRARLHCDIEPGVFVSGDRDSLRQILLNLLDNATKYGPEGQTITIDLRTTRHRIVVSVTDEGPGIPVAERMRVFTPYYRLARDEESARGGSGIGLAVVRDLVGRHGGTAEIVEAAAGGCCVQLSLPVLGKRSLGIEGAPDEAVEVQR